MARAHTAQNTKIYALLACLAQSRPGAARIRQGAGRLSHPPRTALERSYLTENSSSENRILRPRRKRTPDRIPSKRMIIYIFKSIMVFGPQRSKKGGGEAPGLARSSIRASKSTTTSLGVKPVFAGVARCYRSPTYHTHRQREGVYTSQRLPILVAMVFRPPCTKKGGGCYGVFSVEHGGNPGGGNSDIDAFQPLSVQASQLRLLLLVLLLHLVNTPYQPLCAVQVSLATRTERGHIAHCNNKH